MSARARHLLVTAGAALCMLFVAVGCSSDRGASSSTVSSEDAATVSEAAPPLDLRSSADGGAKATGGSEGAAVAAAPSTGAGAAPPAADLLGRKVIRNGTLAIEVESVDDAYGRATDVATRLGGYVAEGSFSGAAEARKARLVIRVPADRYDQAVDALRGLAVEVTSSTSNTQDVTGEVTDLEAALRNLRAVEAQYVALLSRAQSIPDVLQVQERLQAVRGDIERTEGRLALLSRLTDLATITVQLAPVPAPIAKAESSPRSPADAASAAWEASLDTLRQVAVVGVAVVVYSWWLIPLVGTGAFIVLRMLRLRRNAAVVASS